MLGVSDAMLGVAWPSMRAAFGAPLAGLGLVFAAITGGFLAASTGVAALAPRLPTGARMIAAGIATCLAIAGFAVSPGWPALVLAALVYGAAAGLLDPGLNAYVALHHSNRELNLLHAGYGFGASLGPLVVSVALIAGLGWRMAYAPVLLLDLLLLIGFLAVRRAWRAPPQALARQRPPRARTGLALGLASFFAYTGIEVSAGGWSYSYLTLGREMTPGLAALLVGSFWAALTIGRVVAGALSSRVSARALLILSVIVALAGALTIAVRPVVGLPLLGLGLAPIFPTLVSLTPGSQGDDGTPAAVGFQLAVGSLGAAVVPALVGLALQRYGVGLLPALLIGAAGFQLALALGARLRPLVSNVAHPRST